MTDAIDEMIADVKEFMADPKPTMSEMIDLCAREARILEVDTKAVLLAYPGMTPGSDTMRKVIVLDAIHTFLEACQTRPRDVANRLYKMAGPR